ncbi:PREDICTED: copper transporter 5.1-like [Nicotiana attenuata]|uniref:Copper transport protein n=1 Tax=Nicotiana attenuata TaxID=49451 RepID=A0A1J6JC17_NICAT|nr:PREDICTED: copper transporter 5.1-like [Nicotiana attenuata]OIT08371.1 copper transporter 5.1 [Nicotiana attenuata]
MMRMTFYWGNKVTLLFDFWRTDSWSSYALALLACFIVSVFYQYMEDRHQRFKILSSKSKKNYPPSSSNVTVNTPLLYSFPTVGSVWNSARFATAILFGINSAIGYMLMLAIMSFNGGVFVAVVLGLSIGYLLFRTGEEDVVVVDNPCSCA